MQTGLPIKKLLLKAWLAGVVMSSVDAGLPVELEVMAEAEELLQKLQGLLPQLQELMGLQGHSCREGARLFQAHVALLWAMTGIECCSRSGPSGQGRLLVPGVCALPQVHFCCCSISHGVAVL